MSSFRPRDGFVVKIKLLHPGFDHLAHMLIAMQFDPDTLAAPPAASAAADNFADGAADKKMHTRVRLVGLVGATHLNGEEGVVIRRNPTRPERVIVRLHCASANTAEVSVKDVNSQQIDYKDD
jgi:hypothetical protein